MFVGILLASITLYTLVLSLTRYSDDPGHALRLALFQAVSMQTTSGFVTDNFSLWPGALPVIVMISAFIGGCAGSTSGGMKVVRWLLMWKQSQREVSQLYRVWAYESAARVMTTLDDILDTLINRMAR